MTSVSDGPSNTLNARLVGAGMPLPRFLVVVAAIVVAVVVVIGAVLVAAILIAAVFILLVLFVVLIVLVFHNLSP